MASGGPTGRDRDPVSAEPPGQLRSPGALAEDPGRAGVSAPLAEDPAGPRPGGDRGRPVGGHRRGAGRQLSEYHSILDCGQKSCSRGSTRQSSSLSAETKASWGTSTRPMFFIFFFPSFCFSSSLRLRVMSPP